jgi:hypothetical protein
LTNDTDHGGQIRANWTADSDGWETRGAWESLQNTPIVDGETIYWHVEQYIPTGFDASSKGSQTVKKWLRLQGRALDDTNHGYWSIHTVGEDSNTTVRPYISNEPTDVSYHRSSDTFSGSTLDTWTEYDMEVKMKTNGTGYMKMSNGVETKTTSSIDTYLTASDGRFPDDTAEYGVIYFLSYWNDLVKTSCHAHFRNIYISNEMDYDTYTGGSPPSQPAQTGQTRIGGSTVRCGQSMRFP